VISCCRVESSGDQSLSSRGVISCCRVESRSDQSLSSRGVISCCRIFDQTRRFCMNHLDANRGDTVRPIDYRLGRMFRTLMSRATQPILSLHIYGTIIYRLHLSRSECTRMKRGCCMTWRVNRVSTLIPPRECANMVAGDYGGFIVTLANMRHRYWD
jgi:hypothetical protein